MRYVSCRDGGGEAGLSGRRRYSWEEAIFSGWAEDGGMLLPETVPTVGVRELATWRGLSYTAVAYRVMRLFIAEAEMSNGELQRVVDAAFAVFGDKDVVRLRANVGRKGVHVCELWHGPTLAFKDLGMQVLARMLQHFLERRGTVLNLLVGTSGDTGSSAIEAVRALPNATITVLYPKGRGISALQELQMTTVGEVEDRVTVLGVDGTSDDLDVPIEALFRDVPFRRSHRLGSTNSVNICRVLVQVVHYFWAYLQVCDSCPDGRVAFSVPTGACGHITAGALARLMGLPIELHAATNANDIFHRLLSTGTTRTAPATTGASASKRTTATTGTSASKRTTATTSASASKRTTATTSASASKRTAATTGTPASKPVDNAVVPTLSPSMDILMPYNVERLLYLAQGGDVDIKAAEQAASLMRQFKATGHLTLPSRVLFNLRAVLGLSTSHTSDSQCSRTIRAIYRSCDYVLDPHTAVGVHAALSHAALAPRHGTLQVVCMACAHPAKFVDTVSSALRGLHSTTRAGAGAGAGAGADDYWWWLSAADRRHKHVIALMTLQGRPAVAKTLTLDMDWEEYLRHHFASLMGHWRAHPPPVKARL